MNNKSFFKDPSVSFIIDTFNTLNRYMEKRKINKRVNLKFLGSANIHANRLVFGKLLITFI